ncbi:MAG: aminotransferase class V-fold PLP-dependent enzyme [Holophagales bacterium]|jgi:selenocysteine lyase/cysteine desulfurase|nr:aminotransferase class V-fold PLP-dependent enzyme [Holophagales bacterium]
MDLSRESLDREFPWRLSTIQMNHAAVSPLPARAVAALAEYAQLLSTRGPLAFPEMSARLAALREDAARLLGVTEALGGASSIAIVPNTTYGLALVAQGLDWHPGDVVVTTESEFPANLTPWLDLARYGVEVRRVPTRDGAFTAGEVFAACDARTRLVSLSLVAYHTGFVAPAAEVGAFCRESGIAFGLDAIQAAGAIPVDVAALGADFLSADGHKWMLGPEGCGLFFTTPAFRARLRPPSGWMNLKRTNPAQYDVGDRPEYVEDATKFEIGAPPMPGVYALHASIGLLLEAGSEAIGARIRAALAPLEEGLPRLGWQPVLHRQEVRSGILSARPPAGTDPRRAMKHLESSGVACSARAGFLRLSPHFGNEPEDAARVLDLLARL